MVSFCKGKQNYKERGKEQSTYIYNDNTNIKKSIKMRPNSTEQKANAKVKQIRKTGFLKK